MDLTPGQEIKIPGGAVKKKKKKQNKDIFNHPPLQTPINPLLDVEGRFKATFPQLLTEILVGFML